MIIRTMSMGPLQTNGYLLSNECMAVAIDPGGDPAPILRTLKAERLTLTHILNTHLHFDHTYGNAALARATGAPILASPEDMALMESELFAGGFMGFPMVEPYSPQPLALGALSILGLDCHVLPTPGHSPGSLTFYFPPHGASQTTGAAFVGDLIFARSVGRTDFPGGDQDTLVNSVLTQIFPLPPETVIYPGHGPATTVGDEQRHNPFFSEYGEV